MEYIMDENQKIFNTKKRILEAALIEFAHLGLAGARIDNIAAQSGVNKAMIYYHFHSKDQLYQEVINRLFTSVADHVEKFITESDSPEMFFSQLARFYESLDSEFTHYLPIFLFELASGGQKLLSSLESALTANKVPSKIIEFIEKCKTGGQIRPNIDSRQAMVSFIGMNMFYFTIAPLFNKVWEVEDARKFKKEHPEAVVDIFLNGISIR